MNNITDLMLSVRSGYYYSAHCFFLPGMIAGESVSDRMADYRVSNGN